MKINIIGEPKVVMSNPNSIFGYFAWPTAVRLQNGKIAVVASGFRRRHECPHGKSVIVYSEDNGETYTSPAPIIDTSLDERDSGITTFGEKGVIVTSFNSPVEHQRYMMDEVDFFKYDETDRAYIKSLSKEDDDKYFGSLFRISNDCGVTFGEIYKSPVSNPHGPTVLNDGNLLWIGSYVENDKYSTHKNILKVYYINPETADMTYISTIDDIYIDGKKQKACEPYAIALDDGTVIVHIRVENITVPPEVQETFTLFQTVSKDNGKTWTKPEQILGKTGGAPAHIMKHSSGALICTYGFRGEDPFGSRPFGIRTMISFDNGITWDKDHILYTNYTSYDMGYPSTAELDDGSLITVFYAHKNTDPSLPYNGVEIVKDGSDPALIWQQKWSFEK